MVPELQLTCQTLLDGHRPDDRQGVRAQVPSSSRFTRSDATGLRRFTPEDQLIAAAASVGSVDSRPAGARAPPPGAAAHTRGDDAGPAGPLLPAHGDFHANQLLEVDHRLAVIDFDEMCAARRCARLLELRCSSCQRRSRRHGRGGLARSVGLVQGYGSRPRGASWYVATSILRRSPFPFRFMQPQWPMSIERMVAAAEEALHV